MKKRAKRFALGAVVAATLVTTVANAETLTHQDVIFSSKGKSTLTKNVAGEITVKGEATRVQVDFSPAVQKQGASAAQDSASFGLKHRDLGKHSFQLAFASIGEVLIACDAFSPKSKSDKVSILCDAMSGSGTFEPKFVGVATYSATVTRAGKVVQSLKKHKGSFVVKNLDDKDGGEEETLGIRFAYGVERKGAWSMVITHHDVVVTITADGEQKPPAGAIAVDLSTGGLDAVTVTSPKSTTVPKPPGKG